MEAQNNVLIIIFTALIVKMTGCYSATIAEETLSIRWWVCLYFRKLFRNVFTFGKHNTYLFFHPLQTIGLLKNYGVHLLTLYNCCIKNYHKNAHEVGHGHFMTHLTTDTSYNEKSSVNYGHKPRTIGIPIEALRPLTRVYSHLIVSCIQTVQFTFVSVTSHSHAWFPAPRGFFLSIQPKFFLGWFTTNSCFPFSLLFFLPFSQIS